MYIVSDESVHNFLRFSERKISDGPARRSGFPSAPGRNLSLQEQYTFAMFYRRGRSNISQRSSIPSRRVRRHASRAHRQSYARAVRPEGIEPSTSVLSGQRSTTELRAHFSNRVMLAKML